MHAILLAAPVLGAPLPVLDPTDDAFHRAFDDAAPRARVVALLSPT